jgi:hypothetical protein
MARMSLGLVVLIVFTSLYTEAGPSDPLPGPDVHEPAVNTFLIVAYDPAEKEWGVGVASKFLAVGAVVPWASRS